MCAPPAALLELSYKHHVIRSGGGSALEKKHQHRKNLRIFLGLGLEMATRGDDLEDDFIDEGLAAGSDDEEAEFAPLEGEEDQFVADDDDVLYSPETESGTGTGTSGRRSTTATASTSTASASKSATSTSTDEAKRDKKRKKRAKDNERKAKVRHLTFHNTSASIILPRLSMSAETTPHSRTRHRTRYKLQHDHSVPVSCDDSCAAETRAETGSQYAYRSRIGRYRYPRYVSSHSLLLYSLWISRPDWRACMRVLMRIACCL